MKVSAFAQVVATKCGGRMTSVGDDGKAVGIDPVTIVTLITTILPAIMGWVQQCKNKRQDQSAQAFVKEQNEGRLTAARQHKQLCAKVKQLCINGIREEKKRAKTTGVPADLGRYQIDDDSISRLADHSIATFVALPAMQAEALRVNAGV